MDTSVYKIVEVVGFSEKSWEDAAKAAVATVDRTIRDIRVAEVVQMDMRRVGNSTCHEELGSLPECVPLCASVICFLPYLQALNAQTKGTERS